MMAYQVRWKLVGRFNRRLDDGCIDETYPSYGEAAAAINELLRPYPEVRRVDREGYWLARRSADADLAVWVWVENAASHSERRIRERADQSSE
jgi:hypothetical protein